MFFSLPPATTRGLKMRNFLIACLLLLWSFSGFGFTQTEGNVLVANGGIVYEYTPTGGFVGTLTSDLRNGVFSESRGIAYDRFGRIHVLIRPHDGNDEMFLTTVDLSQNSIEFNEISFHNHDGNTTFGDIGVDQNYVYAPDQVFARQGQGIIRYPLDNLGSPERILEQFNPTDVSVGLDGNLYVQMSSGGDIAIINPDTLLPINQFRTVNSMRDVAATSDGTIFTLHNDNTVRRYSSTGVLEASLELNFRANHSLALSENGTIVVGSSGSDLFFTDTSLSGFTQISTPASEERTWGNFVTFVESTAAIDDFIGDVNMDGEVNFGDIPAFIAVLQSGEFNAAADINLDGEVNFGDIPGFVLVLSSQ